MTARAGAQGQASDHGATGTEDIMIEDRDSVAHGTTAGAVVSASATMMVRIGAEAQATVMTATGATDIMIRDQASVDRGTTAMEAGWASAGNHPYRKSPALQGFFCAL